MEAVVGLIINDPLKSSGATGLPAPMVVTPLVIPIYHGGPKCLGYPAINLPSFVVLTDMLELYGDISYCNTFLYMNFSYKALFQLIIIEQFFDFCRCKH